MARRQRRAGTHPRRDRGAVGFGSPTAFRDRFKRIVGTSPHRYRSSFARKTSSTNHSSS
nr:AraC family transcriptional regulator [Actinoplanes tereljensis]